MPQPFPLPPEATTQPSLREFSVPVPARVRALPWDHRGYPIPFFVERRVGVEPDFRVMDQRAAGRALKQRLCWVCGGSLGRDLAFVGGPRSEAAGAYADLPSHLECARFSAQACPFLANPNARMRDAGLPAEVGLLPHQSKENPKVVAVVVVQNFRFDPKLLAFRVGPKHGVEWFTEGRPATAAEVAAVKAELSGKAQ